jgi:hypothetical protein
MQDILSTYLAHLAPLIDALFLYIGKQAARVVLKPTIAMVLSAMVGIAMQLAAYSAIKKLISGIIAGVSSCMRLMFSCCMSNLRLIWSALFWTLFLISGALLGNYMAYDPLINNDELMSAIADSCRNPITLIAPLLNLNNLISRLIPQSSSSAPPPNPVPNVVTEVAIAKPYSPPPPQQQRKRREYI